MVLLLLVAALGLHRYQRQAAGSFERWAFRAFLAGQVLLVCGTIVEYYTPYLDAGFMFLTLPGVLITVVGGLLWGIAIARNPLVPAAPAWLLALGYLPGVFVLIALLGHIPIALSFVMLAWVLLGRHLVRADPVAAGV